MSLHRAANTSFTFFFCSSVMHCFYKAFQLPIENVISTRKESNGRSRPFYVDTLKLVRVSLCNFFWHISKIPQLTKQTVLWYQSFGKRIPNVQIVSTDIEFNPQRPYIFHANPPRRSVTYCWSELFVYAIGVCVTELSPIVPFPIFCW